MVTKKKKIKDNKVITTLLLNGEIKFLGYFSSQEEASKATDSLMNKLQYRKNKASRELNIELQSRGLDLDKPWISTTLQKLLED